MPDQSTSQSTVGPQESQVPAIRSFEFDSKAIGAIKTSVNQFRGSVSLPIDLLTLEGRPGLDVKVSLLYQSNVQRQVETWNVDAPTSNVGLGWQMPFELITVDKQGNGSPTSDRLFLVSGGSANPMVKVEETAAGLWRYELRNYQFWDVLYDPSTEVWRITKEDGSVYTYGAEDTSANAVQWGVAWGNWLGSSSRLDGQETYAVSWNLASITSVLGHKVSYAYENVDFAVGDAGGKRFTQASYVRRIVDSLGRVVTFIYDEKYGRRNPSPQGIVEYQAAHGSRPEPNAFQDRYETRYLDKVEVANAEGDLLYGLQLTYDFVNFAATTDPRRPLLWKRCLRSVFQWSPDGQALPSLLFDYYDGANDTNRGALSKVTYPSGGEATFTYKENLLDAPKQVPVDNPLPGSKPGVWHGSDYVVFTYVADSAMRVLVYSWNGRWVSQDVTPSDLASLSVDPDSVWVAPADEYLALSVRDPGGSRDLLYLFRPDATGFGKWQLDPAGTRRLPLTSDAGPSTFLAGGDFVIAANTAYSGAAFQGFSWDWKTGTWTAPPLLPSSSEARSATGMALAAFDNYYAVALYFADQRQGRFQTFYRDAAGAWNAGAPWNNGNLDVESNDGRLLFNWTPQPGYLVATYVTGSERDLLRYSLRVFQLGEAFQALNASDPKVVDLETTISEEQSRFDLFRTLAAGNLVNNNPANLRNEGGDQLARASANWLRRDFQLADGTVVSFAAGDDVSVATQDGGSGNQLLVFDPNQPGETAWSFQANVDQQGRSATATGRYLTVGRSIYFREDDGTWSLLQTQLNNLQDEASVQNRAPSYLAYQDTADASARAYVVTLANGQAAAPVELPGGPQKVAVPRDQAAPGSNLAGLRALVTYPSSESFASASRFTLYNLGDGDLSQYERDYPVAWIEIANPFDPATSFVQSYFYANSSQSQIAFDPVTGLAQYPKVTTVAGVRSSADNPPQKQPQGRSELFYSNGLSPQGDLRYPVGTIFNYANVLNGVLLGQKDYDSQNRLVGNQLNYWQVTTENAAAGRRLWGAYARPVRTTVTRDGITEDSRSGYVPSTGLEAWREQTYRDATGAVKKLRDEVVYAWQVPEYANTFLARHYLSAEARRDRCVVDSSSAKTYFESRAVTWKDWTGGTGRELAGETLAGESLAAQAAQVRLARWQAYQWKAESAQPTFPYGGGDRTGWVLLAEVQRRTEPDYLIAEQIDTRGTPSSFVYDKDQRYLVASFPGASRDGQEASYWGMEPYEADAGWRLGSGATLEPAGGAAVDAHTGERCVALAAGSQGDDGLRNTFRPQRAGVYGFSAWVKKPDGFDASRGEARFRITVGSAPAVTVDFPAETGDWVHLAARFDVPTAGAAVEIVGENLNPASAVRVDDLTFAPWATTWTATPYDTHLWLPSARLEANGEASRKVYDDFGRIVLASNVADRLSEITGPYLSRQSRGGQYSVSDPDQTTVLRPAEGGSLSTFTRGDEWRQSWNPAPSGVWQVADGRLTQSGDGTAGTLTLRDFEHRLGYTVAARLTPSEAVTAPMGIHVGSRFTVQWQPSSGTWELLDGGAAVVATPGPDPAFFRVPAARLGGEPRSVLGAGAPSPELHRAFAFAGLPLRDGARLTAVGDRRWDLQIPGALHRFDLRLSDDGLDVQRVGGAWTLLVRDRALLFWVDGQLVFSHLADAPISGAPQLFFATRVGISALAAGLAPAAATSFTDASGNPLQQQALEGDRSVVSQMLSDDQGRPAVATKPAYVAGGDSPLLQYCADFARLDWSSGKMTGRVAQAYPADDGFPYSRDVFEASPLARLVERGLPGPDFRVGAHSTHYAYGSNDGSLGLPADSYTRQSVTDPNGNESFQLSTVLGQVVYKVSLRPAGEGGDVVSFSRFDDAGNPVEMRLPNYFQPPQGSTPADWQAEQTFDWAGRPLSTRTGKQGTTEMVYAPDGSLRFMQEPQGAADGTFTYWKYDALGRLVETGYLADTWNRATLQAHADDDPEWPPTPPTWRRKITWDGEAPEQRAVGRVQASLANNGDAGTADVEETYLYDVFGNTVETAQTTDGFAAPQVVGSCFDDAGNLTSLTYPQPAADSNAHSRWTVHYRYDPLRRVVALGESADFAAPLATYAYRADGRPRTEILRPASGNAVTRSFEYNSPLWPTALHDRDQADASVFGEELSYTSGGYDGAAYYDGLIAAARYAAGGGQEAYDFRYGYSTTGEIRNAESAQQPTWNLGVSAPVAYDPNGNLATAPRGGTARRYDYVAGTQRVHQVVNPDGNAVLASYDYDLNGSVTASRTEASPFVPGHQLTFTYDPGLHRVRRVDGAGGLRLDFVYGGNGERVVKDTWDGSRRTERKLYVRGTNSFPLYERTVDAQGRTTEESCYAFGPGGLLAMRRGGEVYGVLKDHLGSVRRVLDATNSVVAAYDYLTFGTVARKVEPSAGFMPYLFTGQEWDAEIGLYNYRARFYSSELGRFLDVDPARQFFSPYIYAANNPVLYVDPTGTFSLKSLFSAIAGVIIGAVEILIGVVVDVIAGVLEVVTGGLSTPASVALAALAGTFYGAGASAILYSVVNVGSFDWKEYGIQMGIGAVAGALSFGIGAFGSAVAEGATGVKAAVEAGQEVSRLAKFANAAIDTGFTATGGFVSGVASAGIGDAAHNTNPGFDLVEGGLWSALSFGLGKAIPGPSYKAGWGNLGKRVLINVGKKEAIGVSVNTTRNAVEGNPLDQGLLNTVASGALWGTLGSLQAQAATKEALDFKLDLSGISFE